MVNIEIEEVKRYRVCYNGEEHWFDKQYAAHAFKRECELQEYRKYIRELGIPEHGLYLVSSKIPTYCDGKGFRSVLMWQGECIGVVERPLDVKRSIVKDTGWDAYLFSKNLIDFLEKFEEYRERLGKTFDYWSGAYHYRWGHPGDGMVHFLYEMHPEKIPNGVNITKIEINNSVHLIEG